MEYLAPLVGTEGSRVAIAVTAVAGVAEGRVMGIAVGIADTLGSWVEWL